MCSLGSFIVRLPPPTRPFLIVVFLGLHFPSTLSFFLSKRLSLEQASCVSREGSSPDLNGGSRERACLQFSTCPFY